MESYILYLAPILGVTDAIYRTAFQKHFGGFDLAIPPFITTHIGGPDSYKSSKLHDLAATENQLLPIHPQLLSKSAEEFVTLAKLLYDRGHPIINWNLGCPMPTTARRGRGAGLLPFPDVIDHFLAHVLREIPNRLSIKIRLGYASSDELDALLPIFNRYPLEEVIIHPRLASQLYSGEVDLDVFAFAATQLQHPIVYNGDINSVADFAMLQTRFPEVKRWMIGRGALKNPFLPAAIKKDHVAKEEQLAKIRAFHDELQEKYGRRLSNDIQKIGKMKEIWSYLAAFFPLSEREIKQIKKSKHQRDYDLAVDALWISVTD